VKREVERVRKDTVVTQFPALYLYSAGRNEENYEKFPHPVMI
jgi:hypothetical protein